METNIETPVSAQDHASTFTNTQKKIALVVVALAFIMDLLDSTIVNIAIPSIQRNLGASYAAIQWLIAGYTLAFAILLVTGGRMGDVFGYKKLFMIGVAGFTLASLLSGVAPNPSLLIVARILQGSMAALMVPQVMSLMQVMFKPEERSSINGLFGGLAGLAATLGPIIGGLLIKANIFNLDWRPIFLINVPVGVIGLIAGSKYLPNGKSSHPLKLDMWGTFLIVAALSLLVFPLIQGRELNWPAWAFIMMIISIPFFMAFAWWQRKKDKKDGSALILPSLFKNHSFGIGLLINLIMEATMLGLFLTFGLVLQIGLGFTPLHAALTGIPIAVGITFVMAVLSQKIMPKLGRYALTLGSLVMGLGAAIVTWVFVHYQVGVHSWQLMPGLLIVGFGMGMIFSSLFAAVLNGVDPRHAGSASGVLNAVQQVGGSIGIALIGVVFFGQLTHFAPSSFNSVKPALSSQLTALKLPSNISSTIVSGVQKCYVDRSSEKDSSVIPASCEKFQQTNSAVSKQITNIITKQTATANTRNFDNAFKWGLVYEVCLLAIIFTLTLLLPKKFKAEAYSEI